MVAAMSLDIEILVTEPQARFLALDCKYAAFVGGFGSGKSETMINRAILDAATSPHALIALYAPTYDLIKLITMPRLEAKLTKLGIKYTVNKTWNTIETEGNLIGNFILRSLDSPERIVGYESYRAHIDEIDVLKKDQANMAWNKIIARNRQRLPNVENQQNRVCAYSTPEGFNFLYDRWVKNKKPGYELVQAASESNPYLPPDYIQSLRDSYPGALIDAYLNGQFVNLTSGTIYSEFDRVKNNSDEHILKDDQLFIGMDFNVGKMAATVFVKRKVGKQVQWHIVDEIYDLLDTPTMIDELRKRYGNKEITIYPDASGTSRKPNDASVSDISLLEKAGFKIKAHKKNPYVKDRITAVNNAFNKQIVFVNVKRCVRTTECLEQQVYGKDGLPEKGTGKDHQNDATGYPIAYEFPIRRPVAHVAVSFYKN